MPLLSSTLFRFDLPPLSISPFYLAIAKRWFAFPCLCHSILCFAPIGHAFAEPRARSPASPMLRPALPFSDEPCRCYARHSFSLPCLCFVMPLFAMPLPGLEVPCDSARRYAMPLPRRAQPFSDVRCRCLAMREREMPHHAFADARIRCSLLYLAFASHSSCRAALLSTGFAFAVLVREKLDYAAAMPRRASPCSAVAELLRTKTGHAFAMPG